MNISSCPRVNRATIVMVSAMTVLISSSADAQTPNGGSYQPSGSYYGQTLNQAPSPFQGSPTQGGTLGHAQESLPPPVTSGQTPIGQGAIGQAIQGYGPSQNYSANQVPYGEVAGGGFNPNGNYQQPLGSSLGGSGLVDPFAPVLPTEPYLGPTVREADLVIDGYPGRTGRIMLGGAVNSDAGLTGQITVDERNFDIMRFPRSFQDMFSGTAFRGAGQTFRVEAAPGTDFKRYTVSFANPNLFGYLPYSLSVSGFLFDRRFNDWNEERLGGRVALGYRVTPDLSFSVGLSGQNVDVDAVATDANGLTGSRDLDDVTRKDNELYGGEFRLIHDTRNNMIQASNGHYFEFKFEQMFGTFDYSRIETEFRQYWLLKQRADGTGKQTLSYSTQLGFSGDETPIFEHFFAGGYATLRGFDFRGAGPVDVANNVELGGEFQWLNSVEYMFPITADDAFRGVGFVDFGTVEKSAKIDSDSFRVAPGVGLRVAIPMLGPAPLAFDFAFPVSKADTDREQTFSFYMSLVR